MTKTRLKQNSDMRLDVALNCFNGIDRIGCRAWGLFEGQTFVRTAWIPAENLSQKTLCDLRVMATGQYNEEIARIKNKLKNQTL